MKFKPIMKYFIIVILIWLAFSFILLYSYYNSGYTVFGLIDNDTTSSFGTIYGGILGTIFNMFSILFVIYAISRQTNDNMISRNRDEIIYLLDIIDKYLNADCLFKDNCTNKKYLADMSISIESFIKDFTNPFENQIDYTDHSSSIMADLRPYNIDDVKKIWRDIEEKGINRENIISEMKIKGVEEFLKNNKNGIIKFVNLYKILFRKLLNIKNDDIENTRTYISIISANIELYELNILSNIKMIDPELMKLIKVLKIEEYGLRI